MPRGENSRAMDAGIMVFRPTMDEFRDFPAYIKKIEDLGAHHAGLAKIIPPEEWIPRSGSYDVSEIGDMEIPAPIKQARCGKQGAFTQLNTRVKGMTLSAFKNLAESPKYCRFRPSEGSTEKIERAYWKNVVNGEQLYGADVSGSLMDPDLKVWNVNNLGSILDWLNDEKVDVKGVNSAYLYFGMWKSAFAWHTEDMDLYSLSYLHFGQPKTWYCIPPSHGERFERIAAGLFPDDSQQCKAFLRHKYHLISPSVLKAKHGLPVYSVTQEAREFIVTFPYSYHSGFNQGFNCAEAVNFATERWVEYGKRCSFCTCTSNPVKLPMRVFVRKLQPDRYKLWLRGEDVGGHPEAPNKKKRANLP